MFRRPSAVSLERPSELARLHERADEFERWRRFRTQEISRFLALAFPRILVRAAHEAGALAFSTGRGVAAGFFHGQEPGHANSRVWGNAAFAIAGVFIDSFVRTGWFNDARSKFGSQESGRVRAACTPRPLEPFGCLSPHVLEVALPAEQEQQLNHAGVISIVVEWPSNMAVIGGLPTVHLPEPDAAQASTGSALIASTLNYLLPACRVTHWFRRRSASEIGEYSSEAQLRSALTEVLGDCTSKEKFDHRHPVRDFRIFVSPDESIEGAFKATIELAPWVEPERVQSHVRLDALFRGARS